MPKAPSTVVMEATASTPAIIQLSIIALTPSILGISLIHTSPRNSRYIKKMMITAISEKNTDALSRKNTFKLREINALTAVSPFP